VDAACDQCPLPGHAGFARSAGTPADPDEEALWRATPSQYPEKIFQVVLTLPALDEAGYRRLLRSVLAATTAKGRERSMEADLAAAIAEDNRKEDAGMHGDDRGTCYTHQSWVEDCAGQPMHVNPTPWVLSGD
jgi:hypothetical protein